MCKDIRENLGKFLKQFITLGNHKIFLFKFISNVKKFSVIFLNFNFSIFLLMKNYENLCATHFLFKMKL